MAGGYSYELAADMEQLNARLRELEEAARLREKQRFDQSENERLIDEQRRSCWSRNAPIVAEVLNEVGSSKGFEVVPQQSWTDEAGGKGASYHLRKLTTSRTLEVVLTFCEIHKVEFQFPLIQLRITAGHHLVHFIGEQVQREGLLDSVNYLVEQACLKQLEQLA